MLKKKITIFYIAALIFTLDRLSKYYVLKLSNSVEEFNIPVTSFLNFNLVWNNGIAFGLFSFNEQFYYNIITLVIVLITLVILFFAIKSAGVERIGFSMIFGGSLGNIFDRLYYSAVVDFIDFHINNIHWFIFNIADIFISLGVIILITIEIFGRKKNMKKFLIYFLILIPLFGCESAREGFTLKKKDNSDEFLIEKKNPLIMPPEYGDLPVPEDFEVQSSNVDKDEFEKIITKSKNKTSKKSIKKTNIEQSVLEKIN